MNDMTPQLIKGNVIGVDIGGTNIRAGLVNQNGELCGEPISIPTLGNELPDAIIQRITDAISTIIEKNKLRKEKIVGIGMGVTGPLDIKNGLILECPQLPTLQYFPLREKIKEVFGIPVIMNNDANAMILGESLFGSGRGSRVVLGFTLGTGLGCAIVMDQKLQTGARELAGEIWASPYKEGIIEDYVSGRGIRDIYTLRSGQVLSALEIAQLASTGDINAKEALEEFGTALGFALAWSINLIDPDVIILGGSISNSFPLFSKSMIAFLNRFACPPPSMLPPVHIASLGNNAGLIGAAALVLIMDQSTLNQPATNTEL
jgi:glucokinase